MTNTPDTPRPISNATGGALPASSASPDELVWQRTPEPVSTNDLRDVLRDIAHEQAWGRL